MILHISYEELAALRSGARTLLGEEGVGPCTVLAPTEAKARVEALQPLLVGDISVNSLEELRGVQAGITAIVECLRAEMESSVLTTHAASEMAVSAYFDFAHVLTVSDRLDVMAGEMEAVIELVTGEEPDEHLAREFDFPD